MVLSTSQQVALAFTAVLFTFVVLPKMLGVGGGAGTKDTRMDPRYSRKGPGPAGVRGNGPGSSPSPENMQQMKKLMEQEMKNNDKFKSSSNNKGYVFTLMPLYAIGVGVFAAYKFLKIKSADDQAQKDKLTKGAKKSAEAENQLNELEQRLAQTERMLNSILTQLDPLTNCVKSVAQEQKNEIMSQLQIIRHLMKKRGMECPPLNLNEESCEHNLDSLIESLGASEYTTSDGDTPGPAEESEKIYQTCSDGAEEAEAEDEEIKELIPEDCDQEVEPKALSGEPQEEEEEEEEDCELMPSLEDSCQPDPEMFVDASGLRRRHKPE